MPFPPEDNNICSSCGTEFGYDDVSKSRDQLTRAWVAKGAPWFSKYASPPPNWIPWLQMINAGLGFALPWVDHQAQISTTVSFVDTLETDNEGEKYDAEGVRAVPVG